MIGALIALLSLDMTRKLVAAGLVAKTLTVIAATNATPIVITTSSAHGFQRPFHAEISDVAGNTAANGTWVCTPVSSTTFRLSTFSMAGAPVNSIGLGDYTSGGTVQVAFPDGSILLGRRNVAMQTSVATPRIVFVPMGSPTWSLDPYGGVIPPATLPRARASETAEQQIMKLNRQLATEQHTFEVHVTGCASPPDPDFGDFDVTQALYHALYGSLFNMVSPARAIVKSGHWVSQDESIQTLDTRGQKWVGIIEIRQPVLDNPLQFVPASTDGTIVVNFVDGASGDQTIIAI